MLHRILLALVVTLLLSACTTQKQKPAPIETRKVHSSKPSEIEINAHINRVGKRVVSISAPCEPEAKSARSLIIWIEGAMDIFGLLDCRRDTRFIYQKPPSDNGKDKGTDMQDTSPYLST